ncbi:MAG: hypothetical protein JSW67_01480 [Candidatus Latescibacterota bacterium]|nr:MAG: hypothetical protein JSW67_01480 [Candidatus Latescibacterota bacterium]
MRRPGTLLLLLLSIVCIILLARTFWNPVIRLDGHGYYAPLASALFDHDFDLRNEFIHAEPFMRATYFERPDGRVVDPFAVGAALLWSPGLLLARAFDSDLPQRSSRSVRAGSIAYRQRYVRAMATMTALQALAGCVLLFIALRHVAGVLAAGTGTVAAALGTPLVYYALAQPSYAHAASFLAASALLLAVLRDRQKRVPIALLGALWGLVAIVRWQDAILGLIVAPRLLEEIATLQERPGSTLRQLALFLASALIVFSPQLFFWNSVYGSAFVYTHRGFMKWTAPQVLPFLFSLWHGAFVYSPLLLLGSAGLLLLPDRRLRWAAVAALLLEIYACAAAGDWWGGGGFSARRLTSVAPLAGLGVACLVTRAQQHTRVRGVRWRVAIVVACLGAASAWNLRLAHYNARGLLPFNPNVRRDYVRHYPRGDARREIYSLWDYPRLLGEIVDAERILWRR